MDINRISWPGWETVRIIGRGSFGAVYEIQRDVFGDIEKAALKVISIPENSSDIDDLYNDGYDDASITATFQDHLKSIVAEYTLMRKLNGYTNIVSCDDIRYVQHDDGFGWDIFIKMELLTPLAKTLSASVPDETVIKMAVDLCAALELCERNKIIHRDIKPQNIFVSPNGDYKLGDFGIAKTVEKTMGGTKIGTYKFMAPEVYNNQPYGRSVDVYSLGLVMYWMLNERRTPFLPLPPVTPKQQEDEKARNRRFSGEPLPPTAHGSEELKKIVLKACAFDPKERYHSAAELREALEILSGKQPVPFIIPVVPDESVVEDVSETMEAEDTAAPETTEVLEGNEAAVAEQKALESELTKQSDPSKMTHAEPIRIRFIHKDLIVRACECQPGEKIQAPIMVPEVEDNGKLWQFCGWKPELPEIATAPGDYHAVYEEVPSAGSKRKRPWIGIICALVLLTVASTLLIGYDSDLRAVNLFGTYFDMDGRLEGWQTIGGSKYYFNDIGKLQIGWRVINGSKYYFDTDTGKAATGFRKIDADWYYFDKDTYKAATGLRKIDANWYYFDKDTGKAAPGLRKIGANWYYFGTDAGKAATGFRKIGANWYYFDTDTGKAATGWRVIAGNKHYFDTDTGKAATGWKVINGTEYFFSSLGQAQMQLKIQNNN